MWLNDENPGLALYPTIVTPPPFIPPTPVYPVGIQLSPDTVRGAVRQAIAESTGIPHPILDPPPPPPPSGATYPITGMIAVGGAGSSGDQTYGPVPYQNQVSVISPSGMFATSTYGGSKPIGWMGRFDIVVFASNQATWDTNGTYDRAVMVDCIKQGTFVPGYLPAKCFGYQIIEAYNDTQHGYQQLETDVANKKWYLYSGANQTGSIVASAFSASENERNWAVAWPTAQSGTAADQAFSPGRMTAAYDGSAEDYPQHAAAYFNEVFFTRHNSVTTVVDGVIGPSAYTDSRFTTGINNANRAPNQDGMFCDNCFMYPRSAGYWDLNSNYSAVWNSPANPWLIRGEQHFMNRWQQILSVAYPTRTYYQFGNIGSWAYVYENGVTEYNNAIGGIKGYMDGGLLEQKFGMSFSDVNSYGLVKVISAYNQVCSDVTTPSLVIIGCVLASATSYQQARYYIACGLMGNGGVALTVGAGLNSGTSPNYIVDNHPWFDEMGGNPGTNIPKKYLGTAISPVRNGPSNVAGLWIRDFQHGTVILNPYNNGNQTITAAQINSYLGTNYAFSYINGSQDHTRNPGGPVASPVSLSNGPAGSFYGDAVILLH